MSKRAAESAPEQQVPAKKLCLNGDHKFKPADVILKACKKGQTQEPEELLDGTRVATGIEVESVDLGTARVVLTGGMSGLSKFTGGSTAQKKEAERRWIELGGNKWQSKVSGNTTILVYGPRKWWK